MPKIKLCRDCGRPVPHNRRWYCDPCKSRHVSGSTEGYGWAHTKVRRSLAPLVDAGHAICARCGEPIAAGAPWDLGHDDLDRSLYSGPEHRRCNRATYKRRVAPRPVSRKW